MEHMRKDTAGQQRDARIEALRLICCLCVIMLHSKPNSSVGGTLLFSRTLFSNLIAEPVSVFLLITGFFIDRDFSYYSSIKKTLKRIFLPLLGYTLLIIIYSGGLSSSEQVRRSASAFLKCMITWNPVIHNTGHLWYLYLHILIVAFSPAIVFLLKRLKQKTTYAYVSLAVILALFAINDLLDNRLFRCVQVPLTCLVPGILIVIAGNLVYYIAERVPGIKKIGFVSPLAFAALNLCRTVFQTKLGLQGNGAQFSFAGLASAMLVCLFVLALPVAEGGISRAVNRLSSRTLGIYIWHVLVLELMVTYGFRTRFATLVTDGSEAFRMYLRFTVLYALVILAICALWTFVFRKIESVVSRTVVEGARSLMKRAKNRTASSSYQRATALSAQQERQTKAEPSRIIDKIAFIYIRDEKLLSTRSKGKDVYYIPGGKREAGESDFQTLVREVKEELSVDIVQDSIGYVGVYCAQAHGHDRGVIVQMTCYYADFTGELTPDSEIEEIVWLTSEDLDKVSPVDRIIMSDLKNKGLID